MLGEVEKKRTEDFDGSKRYFFLIKRSIRNVCLSATAGAKVWREREKEGRDRKEL